MRPNPWPLLRLLARRHVVADADPLPDAVLLRRFAETRDPAAFEVLVWRHGAMVSAACRRVLRDDHAAEDAFQATFLVLARKAGSVRAAESAAGWLHRTARRVAVRAAKQRASRRQRETPLAADPPARPEPDGDWKSALDAAVDRLPDRYRVPVVLCYLDGRSTEDAARLLGIPRGTVLSRLATARRKLADHLTRRGITAPAVGVTLAGLTGDAVTAEAVGACAAGAVRFAAFDSTVTGTAVILAESVMRTAKFKLVALAAMSLAAAAGLGAGMTLVAAPRPTESPAPIAETQKPDAPRAETLADKPARTGLGELQWQRDVLRAELERVSQEILRAQYAVRANSQGSERMTREELDELYAELRVARSKRRATEAEYDAFVTRLERLPDVVRLRGERDAAQEAAGRKFREKGIKPDDAGYLEMKKRVEDLDRQLVGARLKAIATPGLVPPLPRSFPAGVSIDRIARAPEPTGDLFVTDNERMLRSTIERNERDNYPKRLDNAHLELLLEFRQRLERELFVRNLQAAGVMLTDQPPDRSEADALRREVEALRAEVRALKNAKK